MSRFLSTSHSKASNIVKEEPPKVQSNPVPELAFTEEEKELSKLWDNICNGGSLSFEQNLIQFLESFVADPAVNQIGYPIDLLNKISTSFLSYINICADSTTYSAEQYIFSLKKETKTSSLHMEVQLPIFSPTSSIENKCNLRFLYLAYALAKLTRLRINREQLLNHFGNNFLVMIVQLMHHMIHELEDLFMDWSEENKTQDKEHVIQFSFYILSVLFAILRILGHFTNEASSFGSSSSPLYQDLMDMAYNPAMLSSLKVDSMLQRYRENCNANISTIAVASNVPMSATPPPTAATSTAKQPSKDKGVSPPNKQLPASPPSSKGNFVEIYNHSVPMLMSLQMKSYLFSKLLNRIIMEMSNNQESASGNPKLLSILLELWSFVIVIQNETILLSALILYAYPTLLTFFQSCQNIDTITSFLFFKDIELSSSIATPEIKELLQHRMKDVFLFHQVIILVIKHAQNQQSIQIYEELQVIVTDDIALTNLIQEANNYASSSYTQTVAAMLPRLQISTESMKKMIIRLPCIDLYPWSMNHTTLPMFRNRMTDIDLDYQVGLTETSSNYWRARITSFPSNQDSIFDASKSMIFHFLRNCLKASPGSSSRKTSSAREQSIDMTPPPSSSSSPSVAANQKVIDSANDILRSLQSLPMMKAMFMYFQHMYEILWNHRGTKQRDQERMSLFQDFLEKCLIVMKSNKFQTLGDFLFVINFFLFLSECFQFHSEELIFYCSAKENFWQEILRHVLPCRHEDSFEKHIDKYFQVEITADNPHLMKLRSRDHGKSHHQEREHARSHTPTNSVPPSSNSGSTKTPFEVNMEELRIKLRVFCVDLCLEFYWLMISFKCIAVINKQQSFHDHTSANASNMTGGGTGNRSSLHIQDGEDIDSSVLLTLTNNRMVLSDISILICYRWLTNLAQLYHRLNIKSSIWIRTATEGMAWLKAQDSSSIGAPGSQVKGPSGHSIASESVYKFFQISSKMTIIRLLGKLLYEHTDLDWFEIFKPSPSNAPQGNSAASSALFSNNVTIDVPTQSNIGSTGTNLNLGLQSTNLMLTPGSVTSSKHHSTSFSSSSGTSTLPIVNANSTEKMINSKIFLLFKLSLDAKWKDIAVAIILRVLYSCIASIIELTSQGAVANSSTVAAAAASVGGGKPAHLDERIRVYEVIFHDILKCIFHIIKLPTNLPGNNPISSSGGSHRSTSGTSGGYMTKEQLMKSQDSIDASKALLYGLTLMLRQPSAFAIDGAQLSQSNNSTASSSIIGSMQLLEVKQIQNILVGIGISNPRHQINCMKHLIKCMEVLLNVFNSEIRYQKGKDLVISLMSFFTALLANNFRTQEMFMGLITIEKRRKSFNSLRSVATSASSNNLSLAVLPGGSNSNSNSGAAANMHDFAKLLFLLLDRQNVDISFLISFFEMLLNGIPTPLRVQLEQDISTDIENVPAEGFFTGETAPVIKHPYVLHIMLSLVPYLPVNGQRCILHSIRQLFQGRWTAIINLTMATTFKPSIIDSLLDNFPSMHNEAKSISIQIIQVLGRFSISVAELKRIIRVLKPSTVNRTVIAGANNNSDPHAVINAATETNQLYLIDALKGTVIEEEDPQCYFLFEGKECGIVLPPTKKWPGLSHYTFCTWLSFKEWGNDDALSNDTMMMLFSIRQSNGVGFAITVKPRASQSAKSFIVDFFMNVYSNTSSTPTVEKVICSLEVNSHHHHVHRSQTPRSWHFFGVVHTRNTMLQKSRVIAVVNQQEYKYDVAYPKFQDSQPNNYYYTSIGCMHKGLENIENNCMVFHGRMSTIYVYSEALSPATLMHMESLGFIKFNELNSGPIEETSNSNSSSGANTHSHSSIGALSSYNFYQSMILALNPGISVGDIVLDAAYDTTVNTLWHPLYFDTSTHSIKESTESIKMNGKLLHGTHICYSRDIRNALECLGGIKVILPMFAHVVSYKNNVISGPLLIENDTESNNTMVTEKQMQEQFLDILKLFINSLRNTVENQRFLQNNGIPSIHHFLHLLPSHLLSPSIVQELLKLFQKINYTPMTTVFNTSGKSASINAACRIDYLQYILLDFHLWSRAPFDSQEILYRELENYVANHPEQVKQTIGIRKFIEGLLLYYSNQLNTRVAALNFRQDLSVLEVDKFPVISSKSQKPMTESPLTGSTKVQSLLTLEQLSMIRSLLWNAVHLILVNCSSNLDKEIISILNYIVQESTPAFKIEGIQLMLRCLLPDKLDLSNRMIQGITAGKGMCLLSTLVGHQRAKVRLYAWTLISSITNIVLALNAATTTTTSILGGVTHSTSSGNSGTESGKHDGKASHNRRESNAHRGILPSTNTVGNSTTAGSNRKEHDRFKALGIDVGTMAAWYLELMNRTVHAIQLKLCDNDSIILQYQILFQLLQLTFYGKSTKYLINEIEHISMDPLNNHEVNDENQSATVDHSNAATPTVLTMRYIEQLDQQASSANNNTTSTTSVLGVANVPLFPRICIPMLFPAMVELVKCPLVPFPYRIRSFSSFMNSIQGLENFDTFTSIPMWQTLFLDIICCTIPQAHIEQAATPATVNIKTGPTTLITTTGHNVIDPNHDYALEFRKMIGFSLAKLHLMGIQFGERSTSLYKIETPRMIPTCDYLLVNVRSLFDMMKKEQREMGCISIRMTISYIRSYVTLGQFDWRTIGLEVMQILIHEVSEGINALKSMAFDDFELDMRLRILEINAWLMAEGICEFIMFPPTNSLLPRQSSSRTSSNSSSAQGSSNNALNTITNHGVAVTSTTLKRASSDPNYDQAHELESQELFGIQHLVNHSAGGAHSVVKQRLRTQSENAVDHSNEINIPVAGSNISSPTPKTPTTPVNITMDSADAQEYGFYDTMNPSKSSIDIQVVNEEVVDESPLSPMPFKSSPMTITRRDDVLAEIIESLVQLFGIHEKSGSWIFQDRAKRLEAGLKIGITTGRYVLHQLQGSLETYLMNDTSTSSETPVKNDKSSVSSTAKSSSSSSVAERVINNSLWLLIRIILNLSMEGMLSTSTEGEVESSSVSMKAIRNLAYLLNWSKTTSKHIYDEESLFIFAKLLKTTNRRSSSINNTIWRSAVTRLLLDILCSQIVNLAVQLQGFGIYVGDTILGSSSQKINPKSSQKVRPPATRTRGSTFSAVMGTSTPTPVQTTTRISLSQPDPRDSIFEDETMSITDCIVSKLNELLGISGEEKKVSWSNFELVITKIIQEATEREKNSLQSRVDEMGFNKLSDEAHINFENHRIAIEEERQLYEQRIETILMRTIQYENKWLREVIKNEISKRQKMKNQWLELYEEVSNERGPWGNANIDNENAAWMIDVSEENNRMKRKLALNPFGVDYLPKFLRQTAAAMNFSGSNPSVVSPDGIQLLLDVTSTNETGSAKSPTASDMGVLSIWKDLKQYRGDSGSRSSHSHDFDADDEDVESGPNFDESVLEAEYDPYSQVYDNPRVTITDLTRDDGTITAVTKGNTVLNTPLLESDLYLENEKILFSANVEIILPCTNSSSLASSGVLKMTKSKLIFTRGNFDSSLTTTSSMSMQPRDVNGRIRRPEAIACDALWACQSFPSSQWPTQDICHVLHRYYRLRFVAIEIFTTARKTFFFNFNEFSVAHKFQTILRKVVRPPFMQPFLGTRPATIITRALAPNSMQQLSVAWANREISNFEYLMHLNTIAGRTYNDLGQYPIFPWVLADYTSPVLNLRDPRSFRDLEWPIGAQNVDQREFLIAKYEDLQMLYDPEDDGTLPPFHYGTHYSVAGFVLWYLMRIEPYTSLHVQLQDGRIDRADRLFESLDAAWKGCLKNSADAKELIPELYYSPEIFMNINRVPFGITQNHQAVDKVNLPAWAKDPYDFIRKHREALESEYVSLNLHHWIDLVFGYKQRPPHLSGGSEASVQSCNVFFHLTYEHAVDLEKLRESNKELYTQYICQITEFGQTPCQLFTKEHIARQPLSKVDIIWPIASIVRGVHTSYEDEDSIGMPQKMLCFKQLKLSLEPLLFIIEDDDKLITIDHNRTIGCHSWQIHSTDAVPPFKIKVDPTLAHYSAKSYSGIKFSTKGNSSKEKRIAVSFAPNSHRHGKLSSLSTSTEFKAKQRKTTGMNTESNLWTPVKKSIFIKSQEKNGRSVTKSNNSTDMDRQQSYSTDGPPDFFLLGGGSTKSLAKELAIPPSPQLVRVRSHGNTASLISSNNNNAVNRNRTDTMSSTTSNAFPPPPTTPLSSSNNNPNNNILPENKYYHAQVKDEHISSQNFAYLSDARVIFSCGHWDRSIRITSIDTGRLLVSLSQHKDIVMCINIVKDYGNYWLISGSRDCTIMVWDITFTNNTISVVPIRTLFGHDDTINCLAVNPELDMIVSGSDDGTIIMHNLRDGKYIRTIILSDTRTHWNTPSYSMDTLDENDLLWNENATPYRGNGGALSPTEDDNNINNNNTAAVAAAAAASLSTGKSAQKYETWKVNWVGISIEGYLICYTAEHHRLATFSLNGDFICTKRVSETLYTFLLSEDGAVLLTGGSCCLVVFRWVHNLELATGEARCKLEYVLDGDTPDYNIPAFNAPIRSLYLTKQERLLLVGLETGELRILAHDSDYLRERLHRKLQELGIL